MVIQLTEQKVDHHFWKMTGDLTIKNNLETIPDLPCKEACNIEVSLQEVGKIDTAGLAYLIKLKLKLLSQCDVKIRYIHGKENIINLAKLYGVSELLELN
ncbi:hypothetical protein [Gayadomonas joobiniege]|uniref:hypothetical protein n=1 Tax=Gayadomonas joobiniege TaxID=1234606 RepID=UPI0003614650|nr:hypothetical protein [Gayadomonas joobiniege]